MRRVSRKGIVEWLVERRIAHSTGEANVIIFLLSFILFAASFFIVVAGRADGAPDMPPNPSSPRLPPPVKGFTLMELLIVIAIIGLLSSVLMSNLTVARERAMDGRRLEDLRSIQTALQLYYSDHGQYPSMPGMIDGGTNPFSWASFGPCYFGQQYPDINSVMQQYLRGNPRDPVGQGYACYFYAVYDNRKDFFVLTRMNTPELNRPDDCYPAEQVGEDEYWDMYCFNSQ
jgi:prepilin-type N-terminal cleavage/methylation domain-containing protein